MSIISSIADFFGVKIAEGELVEVDEATATVTFRLLAEYIAVSYVSNAISMCEFKTYEGGKPVKNELYYALNISPNPNQSAPEFKAKLVERAFYDHSSLMVQPVKLKNHFYIADSFHEDPRPLRENVFQNVNIETIQLRKTFQASDVCHFRLDNEHDGRAIRELIDGTYRQLGDLLGVSIESYKSANRDRFVLERDQSAGGTRKDESQGHDEVNDRLRKFMRGEEPDNGLLPFICRLDSKDEVHDERMWVKANPSLPYRPDLLDQMRREYVNYKANPAKNAAFMTKRMNIPETRSAFCVAKWEDILRTNREVPDLTGMMCVGGVDYAKTTDFVSAILLFRVDGTYYAIHHSWLCKNSNDIGGIKFPLHEAVESGHLTIVDDVEVSPDIVADWFYEQSRYYDIRRIGIDFYRHTLLKRSFDSAGFDAEKGGMVKLTRPSDVMLAQPKIESAFVNGRIAWGDDKLMRWFTNNTILVPAPNNNFKYGKQDAFTRKTDGFMAFVAAFCVEDDIPDYFGDDEIGELITW